MGFSVNESIQVKHEAFLNSSVANHFMEMLAPTLDFKLGHVLNLPDANISSEKVGCNRNLLVGLSLKDWNSYEIAWDFTDLPLLQNNYQQEKVKSSYFSLRSSWYETTVHMQRLEEENNCLFIEAYALHDELTSVVPLSEITLTCNPHYRYGGNRSEEELETLLQCDTLKELVSYAIGCMMGRYSLDKPGLVLASQGETVRDYLAQIPEPSFAPDDNAIIPLTDQEWFPDDATNRFRDFVRTVWGEEHLQENLDFVAESLCLHAIKTKKGEAALETIRRYLSTQFFKDHLHLQETPHLLALQLRQAESLRVPGLPAPLQRKHPSRDAHRLRDHAHHQARQLRGKARTRQRRQHLRRRSESYRERIEQALQTASRTQHLR